MQKRGQVTVFIIVGVVMLILGGIYYYTYSSGAKSKAQLPAAGISEPADSGVVRAYAESCIKEAAETALFDRIGPQSGYINPIPELAYGEEGIAGSPFSPPPNGAYTAYLGKNAVYYLQATCNVCCRDWVCNCNTPGCTPSPIPSPACEPNPPANSCTTVVTCASPKCKWTYKEFNPDPSPDLDILSRKLARYVEVEFEKCFNQNVFKNIGIEVIKNDPKPSAEVSFNDEDTIITVNQNMTVQTKDSTINLETFRVNIPIRLSALYKDSLLLVDKIETDIAANSETDLMDDYKYKVSQADCAAYNKNGKTNVYNMTNNGGADMIVQFADFSTYIEHYLNTYEFQFAIKNIVITNCVG